MIKYLNSKIKLRRTKKLMKL